MKFKRFPDITFSQPAQVTFAGLSPVIHYFFLCTGGGTRGRRRAFSPVNGRDRSRGVQNDGWRVAHNAGGVRNMQVAAPNPGQVKEIKEISGQLRSGSATIFTNLIS